MRDDTKRALDEWEGEHRRHGLMAIVGVCVLALLFGGYYALADRVVRRETIEGRVAWAVWRHHENTGLRYSDFEVMLGDGTLVRVGTPLDALPEAGARVVLERQVTALGWVRYRYRRATP